MSPKTKKTPGVKTGKSKTKSPTVKSRKVAGPIAGIGSRMCSTCGKKGHNARSHYPGGKLAKR